MMRAFAIHSTAAGSVWEQALPLIERAMKHDNGRVTSADLLKDIEATDKQLWFGTDDGRLEMVAITEICVWPAMKVARFVVLAGEDFDRWWAFAKPMFQAWASDNGCRQFEVKGRKGWLRRLKGWALDHVVMRTEVAHVG
jgi:hypothetical protein